MPDRRSIGISWNLDDKQAALKAKKKFCAEIDAAGRSPSPCARLLRDDISSTEADDLYDHRSGVTTAEVPKHQPKTKKETRNSSRTSTHESNDEAEHHATGAELLENVNVDEDEDENEDNHDSDLRREERAVELARTQDIQRPISKEDQTASRVPGYSIKSRSRSRTDELFAEVQNKAETPKRITTSQGEIHSDLTQNVESVTRNDVHPVKETPKRGNVNVDLLRPVSLPLPDTPIPRATSPTPPLSWFPSIRGVEYHTPFPRGTDASIVLDTIRQPSLVVSDQTRPTPMIDSSVIRWDIKSSLSTHAPSMNIVQSPTISDSKEVVGAGSRTQESELAKGRQASSHKSTIVPADSMRRTKPDPVSSSTSPKVATHNMFPKGSNGIRKQPKGVRMVKEPQRIFKDLGFFFFPDNDVNQQRFMRIRKAMEYGAKFIHPWTTGEGVNHIIVDSDMQYEDVLKHVKMEELPDHITVVNQRYPSDCISNQILVDPKQKLYDVVRRRPLANTANTRQMPQEERTLVQETPIGKAKEITLQKSIFLETFPKAATNETRAEDEAVEETPVRRSTAHTLQMITTPSVRKETRAEREKLLEHPNIDLSQQIQSKIDTLQEEMSKQRSDIFNAKTALARSNKQWTEEMGIDDLDLITGLKITVKDRLQRYEKEMTNLEARLIDLEKRRAELRKGCQEAAIVIKEQTVTESDAFSYNDSFVDIIMAAKAVAHLPVDSDSEDDNIAVAGDYDDDSDKSDDERPAKRPKVAGNSAFQCMEKHDGTSPDYNPNAQTIEILEQMSRYYEGLGDQWRPRAYRMAIKTLKKEPRKIISKDDAIRLPFIGARLAAKIEEIATTNRLRKLDNAKSDPVDKAIEIFRGIYGVGLSQATKWVNEGYRTLEDLRMNKVKLTDNQRVGVEHYDDLQTRIPRAEVAEHGRIVKEALEQLDPAFKATVMGSYRRGASDSGDIDIIVTKPGVDIQHIRHTVAGKLIPKLLKQGFLKFGLATGDENSGTKWHGCSCLPTSKIWRRIDFLFVPYDELGAALIYFTGNDIFNRSMRLLASKKGMRLNQRGLYRNVMRGKQRQKITEGELMEGKDEKRIFEILGVPYRPPEHRIC